MSSLAQSPTNVPDTRIIRFIAGPSALNEMMAGMGDAAAAMEAASVTAGGAHQPILEVPYKFAKASPMVRSIVEMLEGMEADGGMFGLHGASEEEGGEGAKKAEGDAEKVHPITIDIEGPLAPTQQVLNVISQYLQMNYRRSFTEVPKPVREPVFETLRPEEAKFLKEKILFVNASGVPDDNIISASSPPFSTTSPSEGMVVSPPEGGAGSGAAASEEAAKNKHLFKLQVLRTALFLQLSPLAAAISGWFANEMTALVKNDTKATRNAEKLRNFLGVEEDFTEDEKVIIERHTNWPGRN